MTVDDHHYDAVAVDVGNPHAVSFTDHLAAVDLSAAPAYPNEAFPEGVNAEFVQVLGDRHVAMRVYERGSGETRSCGTGTVAAVAAAHPGSRFRRSRRRAPSHSGIASTCSGGTSRWSSASRRI